MADNLEAPNEQYQLPISVGEKLRLAREEKGWTLAQVSAETRITQRHLGLIEAGDFAALPGRSYATGFSRTYATMLGLDGQEIAAEVRAELARLAPRDTRAIGFEPGDPARVPPARMAWITGIAGVILVIGLLAFLWSSFLAPGGSLPWLTDEEPVPAASAVAAPPPPAAPAATGAVVFTAIRNGVWVKFYDADKRVLMQGEMLQGESYTVPAEVSGPQLSTARPTALAISVGGQAVAPLATTDKIMNDVPVSAAALIARPSPAASSAPSTAARRPLSTASQTAAPAPEPAPERAAPAAQSAAPETSPTA